MQNTIPALALDLSRPPASPNIIDLTAPDLCAAPPARGVIDLRSPATTNPASPPNAGSEDESDEFPGSARRATKRRRPAVITDDEDDDPRHAAPPAPSQPQPPTPPPRRNPSRHARTSPAGRNASDPPQTAPDDTDAPRRKRPAKGKPRARQAAHRKYVPTTEKKAKPKPKPKPKPQPKTKTKPKTKTNPAPKRKNKRKRKNDADSDSDLETLKSSGSHSSDSSGSDMDDFLASDDDGDGLPGSSAYNPPPAWRDDVQPHRVQRDMSPRAILLRRVQDMIERQIVQSNYTHPEALQLRRETCQILGKARAGAVPYEFRKLCEDGSEDEYGVPYDVTSQERPAAGAEPRSTTHTFCRYCGFTRHLSYMETVGNLDSFLVGKDCHARLRAVAAWYAAVNQGADNQILMDREKALLDAIAMI